MKIKAIAIINASITISLATATDGYSQKAPVGGTSTKKVSNDVFPQSVGYVNDFEEILTDEQETELALLIKQLEQETTDQIAIVTLPSLLLQPQFIG